MNAVAKILLKLYPKDWQARYGEEMEDLLNDYKVTFHTLLDLMMNVVKAQMFWERKGLWRWQLTQGFAIVSMACLFGYGIPQQMMRQSANYPQATIVNQAVTALAAGANMKSLVPTGSVNLNSSLAPFVIIYNNAGTVVGDNVTLNGHTLTLPKGVFDYTRSHGVDKLTWQPTPTVRIAAVMKYYNGNQGGFVLSGRSLRVVEERETLLLRIAEWTWIGLLGLFSAFLIIYRRGLRRISVG